MTRVAVVGRGSAASRTVRILGDMGISDLVHIGSKSLEGLEKTISPLWRVLVGVMLIGFLTALLHQPARNTQNCLPKGVCRQFLRNH